MGIQLRIAGPGVSKQGIYGFLRVVLGTGVGKDFMTADIAEFIIVGIHGVERIEEVISIAGSSLEGGHDVISLGIASECTGIPLVDIIALEITSIVVLSISSVIDLDTVGIAIIMFYSLWLLSIIIVFLKLPLRLCVLFSLHRSFNMTSIEAFIIAHTLLLLSRKTLIHQVNEDYSQHYCWRNRL